MVIRLLGDHYSQAPPAPVILNWKNFSSNKSANKAEANYYFQSKKFNTEKTFKILTRLKIRNMRGKKTRKISSTFVLKSSFHTFLAFNSSSVSFLENRFLLRQLFFFFHNNQAYPKRAPQTKKIHTSIQAAIAVIPSVFGELVVIVLKMFISTRKRVISIAIRPGWRIKMSGILDESNNTPKLLFYICNRTR